MDVADDLHVIDADTHLVEPVDLWTSRLPARWVDRGPRTAFNADWGMDCWIVGDKWLHPVAYYNWAGWREHVPSFPRTLAESHPGGFDATERLKMMDECGIHAAVLYPNAIGFETQAFLGVGDLELSLRFVQVYNDFQTEFASADPERLIPIAVVPYWDVDACVAEMTRCKEMGHRGVLWGAKLHQLGFARINSTYWDRVYSAAQDLDLSLNLHIGIGAFTNEDLTFRELQRDNYKLTAHIVGSTLGVASNMEVIGTLLVSDIFDRFPDLQVVSVESGFGYLPFVLESLDWEWMNSSGPKVHPGRRLPSEKFMSNMWATFWFEKQTLDILAIRPEFADRLMFETDFPHPACLFPGPASAAPNPKTLIAENLHNVSADVRRKLLHDNAARLYQLS